MWKPALGIAAVLVAVAMSGCAASVEADAARTAAPAETSTPRETQPLTPDAETTAAAVSDEQFIEEFRLRVKDMADTNDATLIAAAQQVCEQYRAGAARADINLIEPSPDQDPVAAASGMQDTRNGTLTYWAAAAYCPEFLPE